MFFKFYEILTTIQDYDIFLASKNYGRIFVKQNPSENLKKIWWDGENGGEGGGGEGKNELKP